MCGRIAIAVAGQLDHLVETALTTVAAYGSFLLAEHFGLSGVLATISAGTLMEISAFSANPGAISCRRRAANSS